jgi:hypothetical protein
MASSLPAAVKHQQLEYPHFILPLATTADKRKNSGDATLREKMSINFIEGGGGFSCAPRSD